MFTLSDLGPAPKPEWTRPSMSEFPLRVWRRFKRGDRKAEDQVMDRVMADEAAVAGITFLSGWRKWTPEQKSIAVARDRKQWAEDAPKRPGVH